MKQDFYIQLISRSLTDKLSVAEQQQLSDWIAEAPANAALFAQAQREWNASASYQAQLEVDVAGDFAKLRGRIARVKQQSSQVKIWPMYQRWWAIAASVLLVLGAVWWLAQPTEHSVAMLTAQTTTQETRSLTLPDGTQVNLNSNTTLRFPEAFVGVERKVELEGEAYFEVVKNAEYPFVVSLPNELQVRVLGTSFLVQAGKEDGLSVQVSEGKVAVEALSKRASRALTAGQAVQWIYETNSFNELAYSANNYSWHTGVMVFEAVPFPDVVAAIAEYFEVEMRVVSPVLRGCEFSGRLPNASLEDVLGALELTHGLQWTMENGRYQFGGGQCE